MQGKLISMIGFVSGSLKVTDRHGTYVTRNGTKQTIWKCECKCGNIVLVRASDLRRKDGKAAKSCRKCGNTIHGHTGPGWQSPTYQSWNSMIGRCKRCLDYTSRGIKVCKRWLVFKNFLEDMGKRPSRKHTIDRIKNHLGYKPGNCRWATFDVQSRNKRSNVWITLNGRKVILKDALRESGLSTGTYYSRVSRGMSVSEAFAKPVCLSAPKSPAHRRAMAIAAEAMRHLSKAQRREAASLYRDGWSVSGIAKRFKVSDGVAGRACGLKY